MEISVTGNKKRIRMPLLPEDIRFGPLEGGLIRSIKNNDLIGVKSHLSRGSNPSAHAADEGNSLMIASALGHAKIIEELLKRSDMNVDEGDGALNPLMEAAYAGHLEPVELLIRHGANVLIYNASMEDALILACWQGHCKLAGLLLDNGAETEWEDKIGENALLHAVTGGHIETVDVLISKGANLNTGAKWPKHTPLIRALDRGNSKMFRFLLEKGADLDIDEVLEAIKRKVSRIYFAKLLNKGYIRPGEPMALEEMLEQAKLFFRDVIMNGNPALIAERVFAALPFTEKENS